MYEEYLDFAVGFAKTAGKIMKDNFSLHMKKQWKSDNTPVTETDLAINKLLIEEIATRFPGHGVLGEEENSSGQGLEYMWICDPVDGTIAFSHGIPVCVFGLALTHKGIVVVSVAYDPFMDRLFSAIKGGGAYLNGSQIHVNQEKILKNSSVAFLDWKGCDYDLNNVRVALKNIDIKLMDAISIIYFGGMIACGEFVASVFPKGDLPNNAPVKLLVEEAGGKVTDLFGNEISYAKEWHTGQLASNGMVHEELVEIIKNNL